MTFKAAYNYMKNDGKDIKLPEWGGFWRWNDEEKTIMIHLRDGNIIDIRETDNLDFTMNFIFREDWEVIGLANVE